MIAGLIAAIFKEVEAVVDRARFLPNPAELDSAVHAFLDRQLDIDQRELKVRGLVEVIETFASFYNGPRLIEAIYATFMSVIEAEIVDVKIAGYRVCALLGAQILSPAELANDGFLGSFDYAIGQAPNPEAIQVVRPVLVRLADFDLLNETTVRLLWGKVATFHATVLPGALAFSCDVVLMSKTALPIIEIVSEPLHFDVFGRLLASRRYREAAALKLLEVGTPAAITELAKAAPTADLTFIVPSLKATIGEVSKIECNLRLLDAIWERSRIAGADVVQPARHCAAAEECPVRRRRARVRCAVQGERW
jgi:hypothetical protein